MCENIEKTITELRARGVKFTQAVRDVSWGRVCGIALPGGGELGLYQPRHALALARPTAARAGAAAKAGAKKKVASKA